MNFNKISELLFFSNQFSIPDVLIEAFHSSMKMMESCHFIVHESNFSIWEHLFFSILLVWNFSSWNCKVTTCNPSRNTTYSCSIVWILISVFHIFKSFLTKGQFFPRRVSYSSLLFILFFLFFFTFFPDFNSGFVPGVFFIFILLVFLFFSFSKIFF